MVIIDEKKYACAPCINGHRSSHCQHPNRPLFEIKKKGRPVSQCETCRLLRTTRKMHLKCICNEGCSSSSESAVKPKTPRSRRAPDTPDLPGGIRDLEPSPIDQDSSSYDGSPYMSHFSSPALSSYNSPSTSTHSRLPTSELRRPDQLSQQLSFPHIPSVSSFPPPPAPPPPRMSTLDPTNLTIYPRIVFENDAAARAAGLIRIPRLQCCSGSCGCPMGDCMCGEGCRGACRRHADEDARRLYR